MIDDDASDTACYRCRQGLLYFCAPVQDDALVLEALTLLRASPGMAKAKEVLAQYAEQARAELVQLPEGAGRRALETLVEFTVSRHG